MNKTPNRSVKSNENEYHSFQFKQKLKIERRDLSKNGIARSNKHK